MVLKEKAVKWLTRYEVDAYIETTPNSSGELGVYIRVGPHAVLEISAEEIEYRAELWDELMDDEEDAL